MFSDMIVRQNQHVAKSHENTKRLKEATTPSFQPALCNKSLQIMAPKVSRWNADLHALNDSQRLAMAACEV